MKSYLYFFIQKFFSQNRCVQSATVILRASSEIKWYFFFSFLFIQTVYLFFLSGDHQQRRKNLGTLSRYLFFLSFFLKILIFFF